MKKVTYINEMPYIYDANHTRSHYLPNGSEKYKNRGETIESIVKYHRGLYTESNPNTSWNTGSDIETESASVKSSEGGLGRNIGGYKNSASDNAGLCGRCTGVAVPLRVVPSPTGLPSKRGPGLGSFSRADRGIGGVRHRGFGYIVPWLSDCDAGESLELMASQDLNVQG